VIDDLRGREHADGVGELLFDLLGMPRAHRHGMTVTWIAPGAPWPPTDLIA